jgi:hypothetical protein
MLDTSSGVLFASCYALLAISGVGGVTTLATLAQCANPGGIVRDNSTGIIYTTCSFSGGAVIAVSGTTATKFLPDALCTSPRSLFPDHQTGTVLAVCSGASQVVAIAGSNIITCESMDNAGKREGEIKTGGGRRAKACRSFSS